MTTDEVINWLLFSAICAIATDLPSTGLYRWRDGKGTIHMTNDFESIPDKFRPQGSPKGSVVEGFYQKKQEDA